MTAPKTFFSKVVDEYGGEYPQAVVVVRDWSISHQETGSSPDGVTPYDIKSKVGAFSYKLSYHYNQDTRAQGKKLRPLYFEDGETMSDVFEGDLSLAVVSEAFEGEGSSHDKLMSAIEIDATMKFN